MKVPPKAALRAFFQNEKDFNDIKYILEKDNLKKSYPLIENNFEFIKKLKKFEKSIAKYKKLYYYKYSKDPKEK